MAVIYLIHPAHGAKVAISEAEAIYDAMHGWRRYDPDTPQSADGINEMAEPRRRGRPRTRQED